MCVPKVLHYTTSMHIILVIVKPRWEKGGLEGTRAWGGGAQVRAGGKHIYTHRSNLLIPYHNRLKSEKSAIKRSCTFCPQHFFEIFPMYQPQKEPDIV